MSGSKSILPRAFASFLTAMSFLGACVLVAAQLSPPPIQLPATRAGIGVVNRVGYLVEKGPSAGELLQVIDPSPLEVGDLLRVSKGGSAMISFTEKMRVVLFNNSELGVISASAPGTPPAYELILQRGGCYGELKQSDGQFELATPRGVKISALGTRFFVVYDEQRALTTVGNFDGLLAVSSAGRAIVLSAGAFVDVPDGAPPSLPAPIPITTDQFGEWARANRSPIVAVELMRAAPVVTPTDTPTPTPTRTQTGTPALTGAQTVAAPAVGALILTPTVTQPVKPPTLTATATQPVAPSGPTTTSNLLEPPTARVIAKASCRAGPGSVFSSLTSPEVGERFQITGRLADESWWQVQTPLAACWLWARNIILEGDLLRAALLTPPPTPTAGHTLVPKPYSNDNQGPTPTALPLSFPIPTEGLISP